uniref:Maelstrom domain-containing protein n=1 Tax=Scylla olivacea TaxID=85551 RepID=A0A0P4WB03_SCYOL
MSKYSPFNCFMMERKPEVERRLGRYLPMWELASEVSEEWQAMSNSEKMRYQRLCSQQGDKLDSYGVPLRLREEENQMKKQEARDMQHHIADIVNKYHSSGGLGLLPFYVISGSFYLRMDEGCYVPAEISLLKFSFKTGIIREFHAIVEPFLPVSYRWLAMKHSRATHNLLPKDGADGEKIKQVARSPTQVANRIKNFLSEDYDKCRPLYTLHSEVEQVQQMLHSMTGEDRLKVYSLDILFQHIHSVLIRKILLHESTDVITESLWEYHVGIACKWHIDNEQDSVRYCTMSCVKRWVFLMCRHIGMVPAFGVVPEEGKHYPVEEPVLSTVVNLPLLMQNLNMPDDISSGIISAIPTSSPAPQEATLGTCHHRR